MEIYKFKNTVIIFVLAFIFYAPESYPSDSMDNSSNLDYLEPSIANVKFSKALPLNDAISILFDVDVAIIESQYKVGNRPIIEFYSLPSNTSAIDIDVNTFKEKYRRHRETMIRAVLENARKLDNANSLISNVMRSTLSTNDMPNISVTGMTLVGNNHNLSKMIQRKNILSLEMTTLDRIKETRKNTGKVNNLAPTNVSKAANWSPNEGASAVYQDSFNGERYSLQFMKWNSNNFDWRATYEHDFFLNNYNNNFGTFLDPNSTPYPSCFPAHIYYSTTWPAASYPYLDTRLHKNLAQCEDTEIPYTLGAAKANAIPTNIWLYTYIVTQQGSVSQDKFKLQGQKGERIPPYC